MARLRALAWACLLIAGCGDARARREQEQLARFPTGVIFEDLMVPGSIGDLDLPADLRILAPVSGRGVGVPVEPARPDGAHDALREGVWTYEYVETTRLAGMDGQVRTNFTDIESSSLGLESQGEYLDNVRSGEWTYRYPDGRLRASGSFVDGVLSGPWTFWAADGSVDSGRSGTYSSGLRVAESRR